MFKQPLWLARHFWFCSDLWRFENFSPQRLWQRRFGYGVNTSSGGWLQLRIVEIYQSNILSS
jgi:hypothetical protein